MRLGIPPQTFFKKKHGTVDNHVSAPISDGWRLRLWTLGLCLVLLLVSLSVLHEKGARRVSSSATPRFEERPVQRSSHVLRKATRGSPCKLYAGNGYCTFQCNGIQSKQPGRVAAQFIASKNISACTSMVLEIWNTTFPNRTLSRGWFPSNVTLEGLKLQACRIDKIDDDALDGMEYLKKIDLQQLGVTELRKTVFNKLHDLKELYLNSFSQLHIIDNGILYHFQKFETLQMLNFTNLSSLLPGITGKNKITSISSVDFRYNYLPILQPNFFEGLSRCLSFYFTLSYIRYIHPGTFNFSSNGNTAQIYLNENRLETLDEEVLCFDNFHRINLEKNPWNCNCSLAWLSQKMKNHPEKFEGKATCYKPDHYRGMALVDVEFSSCSASTTTLTSEDTTLESTTVELTVPDSTTVESTVPESTTVESAVPESTTVESAVPEPTTVESTTMNLTTVESTTMDSTTVGLTTGDSTTVISSTERSTSTTTQSTSSTPEKEDCMVQFTKDDDQQAAEIFSITENVEGRLEVHIGNNSKGWKLFWRDIQNADHQCWFSKPDGTQGVCKLDLTPGKLYVICLLPEGSIQTSPNNCLAHNMLPGWELRTWLFNKDMAVIVGASSAGALLACVLFAGGAYALVRHYPTLIKGNKRVLVVNHTAAKVLIMPKGFKGSTESQFPSKEKVTATSSLSSSTTPRSSTNTYVSVNEPTPAEIIAWRLQRLEERCVKTLSNASTKEVEDNGTPPPIPPYPEKGLSSLSWRVHSFDSVYTSSA